MKKRNLLISAMAFLLLCAGCGEKSIQAEVWVDYYDTDDMLLWEESKTLTLPEFPGVTFTWTSEEVTAVSGDDTTILFQGMPVCNVYLCDLTGDGKPEFCATVSFGSGIVDDHIVVYDYASEASYILEDRGFHDYVLIGKNNVLQVVKSQNPGIIHEKEEAPERGILSLVPDGNGNLQLVMEN